MESIIETPNQNKFLPHSFESGFQLVATWISKFPHTFPLRIFSIFVRAKHLNALNCPNNKQIYFTIFKLIDTDTGGDVRRWGKQGWKTYNSRRRLNKAWQSTDEFHVLQVSQPSGMVCSRCLARKTKLRTGYNRAENFSQQFRSEHNEHIFTGARCFICIRYTIRYISFDGKPNLTIECNMVVT